MSRGLVLSLFPGLGLLDRGFEEAGFCIVRGPDLLWGGDIRTFSPPPEVFDGVIGGPPCQAFSRLRHMVAANGYKLAADLIPEFERVVAEAKPRWWLMENVPDAPVPAGARGHSLVRDLDCGGVTERVRRFSWGGIDLDWWVPSQRGPRKGLPAIYASGGLRTAPVAQVKGGSRKPRADEKLTIGDLLERSGLPRDLLDEAPFTSAGKQKVIGNGVPLPMSRALARAVLKALEDSHAG